MAKIIKKKDGTVVVYLSNDFVPIEKEEASLVKVIRPNGDVSFGVPVKVQK